MKKKSTRPSWYRFGKRSSNKQEKLQASSDDVPAVPDAKEEASSTPTVFLTSEVDQGHIQATPAPIESLEKQDSYFETKSADAETERITFQSPEPEDQANQAQLSPNNPYLALRLGRTKSETDFGSIPRSTFELTKIPSETSSELFDRIRPSQRVQAQRERPVSQEPTPRQNSGVSLPSRAAPSTRTTSSISRLGSLSSSFSDDLMQQTWSTTAINNRRIKFKVKFETETFTNKMSASAARALGVDDTIFVFDQTPLVQLTLLHTVSDDVGLDNDVVVNGDEVEFVVMDEYESRIPQLNLGTGFAHLAPLMEGGEYVYWNPGIVPESLRTLDKLRLYKRFELTMW